MEHSSHAHPLPHGQPSIAHDVLLSNTSCTITSLSKSSPPIPSPNEGVSRQARLLQLRNVGFKASALPTRTISSLFGASLAGNDSCLRPTNKENSPSNIEKRATYGEDLPQNPTSILQELENSTRRKTRSPKPGLTRIFQDSTNQERKDSIDGISWYNEASKNCSPATTIASSPSKRKLREISGNQRAASSSSPITKHALGRSISRRQSRSVGFEVTQHVEYLEQELALAKAKTESNTSPGARKRLSARLRALCAENKALRLELDEWHQKGAKEEEEVVKRLVFESEMKDRLDTLEAECEMKDSRIGDLEWEVECMMIKVKDAEGLDRVNADLEKRIDALTDLLTTSPVKTDVRSATTSPNKLDSAKRASRPRPMLTKTPLSPGGVVRLSLATVSEVGFQQSQPLQQLDRMPMAFEPTMICQHPFASPDCSCSPTQLEIAKSPTAIESLTKSGYFNSRSRASTSMRSAPLSSSRPTSFMSTSSFSGPLWGISTLQENDEVSTSPRKRRMRRFASGSKSLKPLVLPVTAHNVSLPVSAPVCLSSEARAGRDFSDTLLDPKATSFLKRGSASPISTPIQSLRRKSTAEAAREEALKALEGRTKNHTLPICQKDPLASLSDQSGEHPLIDCSFAGIKRTSKPRPRSLQEELKDAEPVRNELRDLTHASEKSFEDGLILVSNDATPDSSPALINTEGPSSKAQIANYHETQQGQSKAPGITRESKDNAVKFRAANIAVKGCSSSVLTMEQAQGIFTRLTSVFYKSNENPLLIAKRLVRSSWSIGVNHLLGGLGWWLLGLIYRWHKKEPGLKHADLNVVDAPPDQRLSEHEHLLQQEGGSGLCEQGFQSSHVSAEADRKRAAKQQFKDYGATWLSPTRLHKKDKLPAFLPYDGAHLRPHPFPCSECGEPPSRRKLRLWFHFSLTVVMAIAMAIKHGPGALLTDLPGRRASETDPLNDSIDCEQAQEMRDGQILHSQRSRDCSGGTSKTENSMPDSGYESIVFAQTLGPGDFEGDSR